MNQDSFENLMELREMTEAGMMRLAILKYDADEIKTLEKLLKEMEAVLDNSTDTDPQTMTDAFFRVDNAFHDTIDQMGKNPLADKINRVVRTLTYSMRYETVSVMIHAGRGAELLAAHQELYNALERRDVSCLSETVRGSYFGEVLQSDNQNK